MAMPDQISTLLMTPLEGRGVCSMGILGMPSVWVAFNGIGLLCTATGGSLSSNHHPTVNSSSAIVAQINQASLQRQQRIAGGLYLDAHMVFAYPTYQNE